jgi:ssDNA-binding replication factor A large subunit
VVEVVVKFVDEAVDLIDAHHAAGQIQETVILYVSKCPRYRLGPRADHVR